MANTVTSASLLRLRGSEPNLRILDLRTPEEVATGIIPGAESMDLSSPDIMARISSLPKDAPYCLYCATGGRSMMAAEILSSLGFSKVYDLEGGIAAWIESGGKVAR